MTVDGIASYDGEWHDHPVADGTLYGAQRMFEFAAWTLGSDGTWTTPSVDVSDFAETGSPILTAVSTFDRDEWTTSDGIFELDSDPASLTSGPDLKIAAIQDEHQFVSAWTFSGGQYLDLLGGLVWTDIQAETTTTLTLEDGLPSDDIRALADSPDGAVWIAPRRWNRQIHP